MKNRFRGVSFFIYLEKVAPVVDPQILFPDYFIKFIFNFQNFFMIKFGTLFSSSRDYLVYPLNDKLHQGKNWKDQSNLFKKSTEKT